MPGAYTHLTMVNQLAERRTMEKMAGMPPEAIQICGYHRRYCELGVVSPDYPYLKIGDSGASHWADRFHNRTTDAVVRAAIDILRGQQGDQRDKGLAWLLGYFTHIVMDVVMHPVINKKVGPYLTNKKKHRTCEMNQDVHVFKTMMNLEVKLAEFLNTGVLRCGPNPGTLDPDIVSLWSDAISHAYPAEFAESAPDPASWHRWFGTMVDKIAEENDWLVVLSRHMLGADAAISYPPEGDLEEEYIVDLPRPDTGVISFDELFTKTKGHAVELWPLVARAVLVNDDTYKSRLAHWDMDTGADSSGKPVFWR